MQSVLFWFARVGFGRHGLSFYLYPMKKQAATVHRKRVRVKLGRHTKHANKRRRTKAYKGQGR